MTGAPTTPRRGPDDPVHAAPESDPAHRRRQLLYLNACGLTDSEIAQRLGITRYSVQYRQRQLARALGAADKTAAVAIGIRRGLIDVTRIPGDRVQPLTGRQTQVLRLIADGLTNEQIADQLFLRVNSVKTHIKVILASLDASSRTHAVALGAKYGHLPHLLPPALRRLTTVA